MTPRDLSDIAADFGEIELALRIARKHLIEAAAHDEPVPAHVIADLRRALAQYGKTFAELEGQQMSADIIRLRDYDFQPGDAVTVRGRRATFIERIHPSRGEDIAKLCPEDGGGCHFVRIGEIRK